MKKTVLDRDSALSYFCNNIEDFTLCNEDDLTLYRINKFPDYGFHLHEDYLLLVRLLPRLNLLSVPYENLCVELKDSLVAQAERIEECYIFTDALLKKIRYRGRDALRFQLVHVLGNGAISNIMYTFSNSSIPSGILDNINHAIFFDLSGSQVSFEIRSSSGVVYDMTSGSGSKLNSSSKLREFYIKVSQLGYKVNISTTTEFIGVITIEFPIITSNHKQLINELLDPGSYKDRLDLDRQAKIWQESLI